MFFENLFLFLQQLVNLTGLLPEQLRVELASLDERYKKQPVGKVRKVMCVWLIGFEIRVSDLERRMQDLASLYPQDVQAMRDELEQHKQILGNAPAESSSLSRRFFFYFSKSYTTRITTKTLVEVAKDVV